MDTTLSVSIASNLDVATSTNKCLAVSPLAAGDDKNYVKSDDQAKRVFLTITIFITFIAAGFNGGVVGPTLVHLEYLYNTNTAEISMAFVGSNIGYLTGTIVCVLVFDRFNAELQFAFWGLISAVTFCILPWMPNLYYFIADFSIQTFALSIIYSAAQSYTVRLWQDKNYHRPVLQASHVMWCFGNLVVPFMAIPFLVELPVSDRNYMNNDMQNNLTKAVLSKQIDVKEILNKSNNTTMKMHNESNGSIKIAVSMEEVYENSFIEGEHFIDNFSGVHQVKYLYGIIGTFNLFAALLFCIAFIIMGPSCKPHKNNLHLQIHTKETRVSKSKSDMNLKKAKHEWALKAMMVTGLNLFMVFHTWHRFTIANFITTFTVKGLGWPASHGALLPSLFYGLHTFGAIIGIFLSKYMKPSKIVIINQLVTTLGITLLLFANLNDAFVWAAVAITGFFLSTTFPSLVLWTAEYMTITASMGGMFMAGSAVGGITCSALVGYLFEHYTHMWLVYISLASSILCIVIFVILLVVGRTLKQISINRNKEIEPEEGKFINSNSKC